MRTAVTTWALSRDSARKRLAEEQLSNSELEEPIKAHDNAIHALLEAQEQIPRRLELAERITKEQHDWLSTFALIFQSIDLPRTLILGGAYAPVCALLKQEWDGIAVLQSISLGKPNFGKSPNILNFLGEKAHRQHRLLHPIAHLTGEGLGQAWAVEESESKDTYRPTPKANAELAVRLFNARSYLLGHLFLQLQKFIAPIEVAEAEEKLRKTMAYLSK